MGAAVIYSGDDTDLAVNVKAGAALPVPATDTALVVTVRDPVSTSGVAASAAAPGTTDSRVASTAGTNATSLKGSPGNLYGFLLANTSAKTAFIKFYDKATPPTVGTDTPKFTVQLPPAGPPVPFAPPFPVHFSLGIAYALTQNPADADTTPVKLDQVHGEITWF